MKKELWTLRSKKLSTIKTENWTLDSVIKAVKSLKNNKTRDPHGIYNETLKDCAEENNDLMNSLVKLFNGIKYEMYIPEYLSVANITSLYKNKGERCNLENDRGIFILSTVKKALDKLLYNDMYEIIAKNMSNSNIGARKNMNVRNHIFVIHGIINEVVKDRKKSIHLNIYDIIKAFDKIDVASSMNDLYESIPDEEKNDKLALLYKLNEDNHIAVNTPVGITDRINVKGIVH